MFAQTLLGAVILAVILAASVLHLPGWLRRMILRIPGWLQATILHFGYSSFIGGVTGHLMGAPLAITWFGLWTWWLRPVLLRKLASDRQVHGRAVHRLVASLADRVRVAMGGLPRETASR